MNPWANTFFLIRFPLSFNAFFIYVFLLSNRSVRWPWQPSTVCICRHWHGNQRAGQGVWLSLPLFDPDFSIAETFCLITCIKGPWARGRVKEELGHRAITQTRSIGWSLRTVRLSRTGLREAPCSRAFVSLC